MKTLDEQAPPGSGEREAEKLSKDLKYNLRMSGVDCGRILDTTGFDVVTQMAFMAAYQTGWRDSRRAANRVRSHNG